MSPLRRKSISRKKADPIGQAVFYPSSVSCGSTTIAAIAPASSPIFSRLSFRRQSASTQSTSTSAPSTPAVPQNRRITAQKQAPAFFIGNMADLPSTPGRRDVFQSPGSAEIGIVSPLDLEGELGAGAADQPPTGYPFPSPLGPSPGLIMTTHSQGAQFIPPSPHSLSDMLQNWNLATPPSAVIPRHDSTFGILASDSIDSLSTVDTELRSPPELPSTQGFNSRVLGSYSPPDPLSSRKPSAQALTISPVSPYPFFNRLPAPSSPNPVRTPIPYRQPSWADPSRERSPSEAVDISRQTPSFRPVSPFSPTRPRDIGASPTPRSTYGLDQVGPSNFDLFTPGYSMDTEFSPANSLGLSVDPAGASAPAAYPLHRLESTFGPESQRASSAFSCQSNDTNTSSTGSPRHAALPSHPARSKVAAKHLSNWILPQPFTEAYDIRDELGSGGFGFVCSAIMTGRGNEWGREVAVKFIFKEKLQNSQDALVEDEPMESWVLRHCDHPNIIAWLDLFEDEKYFILVQELHGDPWSGDHTLHATLPEGYTDPVRRCSLLQIPSYQSPSPLVSPLSPLHMDLNPFDNQQLRPDGPVVRPRMGRRASHDLFEAVESVRFTEEEAKWIFNQIVSAVAYLHSRGAYHRDLKDENIVIDRYLNVKIIDFGSAVVENQLHAPALYGSFRGTYSYAAPEVIRGSWYRAAPCDVWAIGIILAILLTGEQPFPDQNMALAGRFKLKRPTSEGARDLMEKMFRPDPTRRWNIEKIQTHRWLRNVKRPRGLPTPTPPPSKMKYPMLASMPVNVSVLAPVSASSGTSGSLTGNSPATTASSARSTSSRRSAAPPPSLKATPAPLNMAYSFGTYAPAPDPGLLPIAPRSTSTYTPPPSGGRHGSA